MYSLYAGKMRYGFTVGRVSVLETSLIGRARLNRLAEAETVEEAQRVLAETVYGPGMRQVGTAEEVETTVDRQIADAYKVLSETSLPLEMAQYFQNRHDFTNLRVLLKSGFGHQITITLSGLGEVPGSKMESLIAERSFSGLPPALATAAEEAVARYRELPEMRVIDIIVDNAYFARLMWLARRLRSKWIEGYTRLLIDLANIRAAVRRRTKAGTEGVTTEHLINGGELGDDMLLELANKDVAVPNFGAAPANGQYNRLISEWVGLGMPIGAYDILADNIAVSYLLESRRFTVGPEPVFAYVAAREHEAKLVRTIMVGLISGLSTEKLQERLTNVYE